MCIEHVNCFDFRDICITEFDEIYGKFGSCSTPLSKRPRVSTKGVSGTYADLFWRSNRLNGVLECTVPCDSWAFHLPHPDEIALSQFIAHPEGARHTMLGSPSDSLIWHSVYDVSDMALVVRYELIQKLLSESELDSLFSSSTIGKRRDMDIKELRLMSRFFYELLQRCVSDVEGFSRVAFDECVSDGLAQLTQLTLRSGYVSPKIINRERILTRALDYIRQNYRSEITVRDLVDYAHATSRNLQIVFKNQFGVSPLHYLRQYRLIKFHKYLAELGSVTEAASSSGLRHMGRLSDQYRLLFGEKPGDYVSRLRESSLSPENSCCCGHCLV